MPLLSSSPSRPNIAPGSRLCPTTFRTAPPLKPCRPSTNSISTNSRRSNRPEASAAISTLAWTPIHRVAQVGKQAPPTRAARSLVRALRGARGALLFATWTTLCRRHKGVLVARRSRGPFARRLTEQDVVDRSLVVKGDSCDLSRQGEDDMEVRDGQELG